MDEKSRKSLFRACFFALMATSFGFMLRAMLITGWGVEFNLTKTLMGEIMGVGLWPFAARLDFGLYCTDYDHRPLLCRGCY